MDEERRRPIVGLDLVRFAAAMAVMLFHLSYWWWLPNVGRAGGPNYASELRLLHEPFRWGWVGVSVFFVVSGFVIAYSADGRSLGQFLKSRVLRLYPAAWICASLTLFIARWGAFGDYLRSVSLCPVGPWISGVYWTLGVEIVFYAAVAMALKLRVPLVRLGVFLGTLSALYWVGRYADFATGSHLKSVIGMVESPLGSLLPFTFGCYFSLGIMLWSINHEGSSRWKVFFALSQYGAAMLALLASGRFYVSSQGGAAWQAIEPAVFVTIGIALILASLRWNDVLLKLGPTFASRARDLGLITYPLYLLHSEIGHEAMLRMTGLPAAASLLLTIAGILGLAFLVVWLERLPRGVLRVAFEARARPIGAP